MKRKNNSNKLWLKPRGQRTAPSRTWFRILLSHETNDAWYGREAYNPTAPILEYPKTSWEPVVNTTLDNMFTTTASPEGRG